MILPRPNRRAQLGKVSIMTRSSLGLERNLYTPPEPWPRVRPTPRPSPGLEQDYASPEPRPRYGPPVSRLPIHGDRTADGTWAMPLSIRGRKRHPLCYQLSSLLHLTFATVSTAGQGRGWEMLNLGTVAIIKHHYSLTQDGERGLGGNCHDPKQGSARLLQGRT